mmetsp:Transcript_12587/g.23660  ORF Transcript_12587/g.23660 Transcript_12587/m.23660 type:complete len:364 (-) Transcript_12587:58-1149(-)
MAPRGSYSIRFVGLVLASWVFIVANSVGASMMGFEMPRSPVFLLVETSFESAFVLLFLAKLQGEHVLLPLREKKMRGHIWLLTALAVLNGLFFQFSDPWVSGVAAQILTNASIPAVGLSSMWVLGERFSARELFGAGIVLGGILLGMLPQMQASSEAMESNPWWAILLFSSACGLLGLSMTLQDSANRSGLAPATTIFWYNLFSVPAYLFAIPLEIFPYIDGELSAQSLEEVCWDQVRSLRCVVGRPFLQDVPSFCTNFAWFWPQVWMIGYSGMFYLNAVLMLHFNAFWVAIVNTAGAPLSAMAFTSSSIVGARNVQEVQWPCTIASFVLILLGMVVKGVPANPAGDEGLRASLADAYQEATA